MSISFDDASDAERYRQLHHELQKSLASQLRGNMPMYSELMSKFQEIEGLVFKAGRDGSRETAGGKAQPHADDVERALEALEALPLAERFGAQPVPHLAGQVGTEASQYDPPGAMLDERRELFPDTPTRRERPFLIGAPLVPDVTEMPEVVARLREQLAAMKENWAPTCWGDVVLELARLTGYQAHVVDEQLLDTAMGRAVIRAMGLEDVALRLEELPVEVVG